MTSPSDSTPERRPAVLLDGAPARALLRQALPLALILSLNGLLGLVDAVLLGRFVGAEAMAAVSLAFPVLMLLNALAMIVGGGMAGRLSRHLGAGEHAEGAALLAGGHGLALALAALAIAVFALAGWRLALPGPGIPGAVAHESWLYLAILVGATPVQFLLAVQADAFRAEGRTGTVALLSVVVTGANIALDTLFVLGAGLAVAGTAVGTVLAQIIGLALLLGLRGRTCDALRPDWKGSGSRAHWGAMLREGAPLGLGLAGIATVATAVLAALNGFGGPQVLDDIAAYGLATRLFGFAFLPFLALAFATQTLAGAAVGARDGTRARQVLVTALAGAAILGFLVQIAFVTGANGMSSAFLPDPGPVAAATRILPIMAALYVTSGPLLVTAFYLQGSGKPGHAALLTLTKPFLLLPALVALLALLAGREAIWYAFPLTDAAMVGLAAGLGLVLWRGGTVKRSRSRATGQATGNAEGAA